MGAYIGALRRLEALGEVGLSRHIRQQSSEIPIGLRYGSSGKDCSISYAILSAIG